MMKVRQAIGVIMGAILGTSVTGWILCLSSLEGGSGVVQLFSTDVITGVVAVIGIILRMFNKKTTNRHVGEILLGFAVLMYGMSAMSGAVSPLRESEAFIRILTSFSTPLLGILVGMVFTVIALLAITFLTPVLGSFFGFLIPLAVVLFVLIILHPYAPKVLNNVGFAYLTVACIDAETFAANLPLFFATYILGSLAFNGVCVLLMKPAKALAVKSVQRAQSETA